MNMKSILLAGAISLGAITLASAATQYVFVTGSTAARAAFFTAVSDNNTVFDAAPSFVGQGSGTPASCSFMSFHGNIGGNDTIVKCHWSGSEGGIADLVGGTQSFLDDAATSSSGTPGPTISSAVDLAMADNDKAFSKNPGAAITGSKVCVIPFAFVKEKGSAAALTGVTDQNLRQALRGGTQLSMFTGNPADTTFVYVTGRDSNSGTRVNAFGVTGYGIFAAPFQLQVDSNGSMHDQGAGTYLGDFGYSGGGAVVTQMVVDLGQATSVDVANGTGVEKFSVVAYLGRSDANAAIAPAIGGTELSYNGVFETPTTVKEGVYTFWGNEYIYRKNTVSSQATTVFNKLSAATGISGHADGATTIKLADMNTVRNGPTSDPGHK